MLSIDPPGSNVHNFDLSGINPSGGRENCLDCTLLTRDFVLFGHLRPAPHDDAPNRLDLSTATLGRALGMLVWEVHPPTIADALREVETGYYGIILVEQGNDGHAFFVDNRAGDPIIYDGQLNIVMSDPSRYARRIGFSRPDRVYSVVLRRNTR